jgi:hypothetical protein
MPPKRKFPKPKWQRGLCQQRGCGLRVKGRAPLCEQHLAAGERQQPRVPRWTCACGRRHRDYILRCACGFVRETEARMMSKQERLEAARALARERAQKRVVAKVHRLTGQPVPAPPERPKDLTHQHRSHHSGEVPDQCANCRREAGV